MAAPGDGRPDHDVVLPREAVEKRVEGSEERHEDGRALAAAELGEGASEPTAERDEVMRAPVALHRRSGAVGRQAEPCRGILQLLAPVGDEGVEQLPLQALALPHGEVRVLDRKVGQDGWPAVQLCAVQLGELPVEDPVGRRVVGDVVDREQEHVVGGAEVVEHRPDHELGTEVERLPRLLAQRPCERLLALPGRQHPEVDERQLERPVLERSLSRLSSVEAVDRPQALVPLDDAGEGGPERAGVELSRQP